jgi:hypothetical protein
MGLFHCPQLFPPKGADLTWEFHELLLPRGGIPPAARRRSGLSLTLAEREDVSQGIASGSSIREIASGLDRAASTVSREAPSRGAEILSFLSRLFFSL